MPDQPLETTSSPISPTPETTEVKPKPRFGLAIFIGLLGFFFLYSITATYYFYFYNQQLKKIAVTDPTRLAESGSAGESGSPTPTIDPTADWQTYTNTSASYAIKFPPNWEIENVAAGSMGNPPPSNSHFIQISSGSTDTNTANGSLGIEELQLIPPSEEKFLDQEKTINGIVFRYKSVTTPIGKTWYWVKVPGQDKYLSIFIFNGVNEVYNQTLNQILSTFEFLESNATTPTLTPKSTVITLNYSLPSGWVTAQDPDNAYEIGYNPAEDETRTYPDTDNRLFLVSKTGLKSMHSIFRVTNYDGGSRHAYLEKMMGEPLNSGDKLPDFREVEYIIQGKKCLIYDGYAISMSPQVWGMCPISSTKALFFNLSRQNLLERLKTIKFL